MKKSTSDLIYYLFLLCGAMMGVVFQASLVIGGILLIWAIIKYLFLNGLIV